MLPTFVIGLREGLEAALIVGIVAAFLRKQQRTDLLRWVWAGVGAAVALCLAGGIVLEVVSRDLPQRQQEGLETVIGVLAIAMVTYMVVWMRRHSRELKGSLEGAAASALTTGSGRALVAMAFLAVIREGFETVVFLLATFNESGSGTGPVLGAVLGVLVAVGLGWGVYRGGVRINLSRFFRATGLVLVVVAAGLVMTAFHTAHEGGWVNFGQGATIDLTWLVEPGSVQASLITGMLGMQPRPVTIVLVAWLVYLIPVALYVGWPAGRKVSRQVVTRLAAAGAIVSVATAGVLIATRPDAPTVQPAAIGAGFERTGAAEVAGLEVIRYSRTTPDKTSTERLTAAELARHNGGRLPLGLAAERDGLFTVTINTVTATTISVAAATQQLVATDRVTRASLSVDDVPIGTPSVLSRAPQPADEVSQAMAKARGDVGALAGRHDRKVAAGWLLGLAVALIVVAGGGFFGGRSRRGRSGSPAPLDDEAAGLIQREVSLT
jgi:high-affinity iron transporter